jgi:dipeptidyl-peptidase-4
VSIPVVGGKARALTTSGKGTVHWGEAEFVAQEEMDRRTGFWWSPDEKRVAVERFDEAPVKIVSRAAIGAEGTTVYNQRYPAAGTPNVLVELHIVGADGTSDVKVDLGSEPDIYLARVDWLPDGTALLVQRENRAQTRLDVLRVDPATGKSTVLFTEASGPRSWINLSDAYRLFKDGSIVWRSERDGFGHLYHWKKGGWIQLTSGQWVVSDLVGVDERKGRIFFTGNKDDALEQHLYSVDLARPGQVTRLTPMAGWNAVTMNGAATRAIVTHSTRDQPPQVYLADAEGKRLRWIEENALVAGHPYFPFVARHRPTENGTLKAADGSTLHWEMIKPAMERGKRYPVFFEHYGGPGTKQQVSREWAGVMRQYLVDQGWIYVRLDNRGSNLRGKAFEDQIYRAMGGVEVADQLAGAEWLKTLPFVDPAKIATYGWSYGGYMTIKMLAANPGVYAAGIAGAPVTKWELYDTHYTERYLGDPRREPNVYATSDALAGATSIADPLLIVHGMADDNVIFENTTALMARMQAAGRPFDVMVYPGQTHGLAGPGISVHLWKTILAFLDRNVVSKGSK